MPFRTPSGIPAPLSRAMEHPLLTESEERALGEAARVGDNAARDCLILSNMRLVEQKVRAYHRSVRGLGFTLDDLRSVGIEALVSAVDKFDPNKGRLTTLLELWVIHAMRNYVADNIRSFRPSDRAKKADWKIQRLRVSLAAPDGTPPDNEVVARALTVEQLERKLGREPTEQEVDDRLPVLREWVAVVDQANGVEVPLDAAPRDGTHAVELPSAGPLPDEVAADAEMVALVSAALDELPPRDAEILRRYYGIGRRETTFEQIALDEEVGRERIRQLRNRSLERLPQGSLGTALRALYEEMGS